MTIVRTATLAASVLMIASCSKLHGMAGETTDETGTDGTPSTKVHTGPLPWHSDGEQGWHVHTSPCRPDDRLLGMCGNAPSHTARALSLWPRFESSPSFHRQAYRAPRSR